MIAQNKKLQRDSLVDFITKNINFALVRFEKTSHTSMEVLRRELKKSGGQFKVIKNSILVKTLNHLAINDKKLKEFKTKALPVKENTGIIGLGSDWSKSLSSFYNHAQKEKTLSFKIGILDSEIYLGELLTKIAKLPGREVLYAKIIGSLKSPITKLTYALKFNQSKLVYILKTKAKQAN